MPEKSFDKALVQRQVVPFTCRDLLPADIASGLYASSLFEPPYVSVQAFVIATADTGAMDDETATEESLTRAALIEIAKCIQRSFVVPESHASHTMT